MKPTRILILTIAVAFTLGLVLSVAVFQLEAEDPIQPPATEVLLDPSQVLPQEQLVTLSDEGYGYTFRIPANWILANPEDHPGGRFTTYISPIPNGKTREVSDYFMSMSFSAHRASKFMPAPAVPNPYIDEGSLATSLDILPYLPKGEIKTIGEYTVHIYSEHDPRAGDLEVAPYGTTVHFLVEDVVYLIYLNYLPPTDLKYTEAAWREYNQVLNTILYSFRVDKNAPYFVNHSEPLPPNIMQAQMEQYPQVDPHPLPPTRTPVHGYPHLEE